MHSRAIIPVSLVLLVSSLSVCANGHKHGHHGKGHHDHHGHHGHHHKGEHGHHHMGTNKDAYGLMALPPELIAIAQRRGNNQATRFSTVKIAEEQARIEINFWSKQLSEHALFLHLGLEDTNATLKNRALALHKKFESFRRDMKLDAILPLCKELRGFKEEVLNRLVKGEWIGWIFPLFARHILLELDYFVDKLNGIVYSDREEVVFWDVINCEHAGFAAHLLDPTERDLSRKGNRFSKKFERLVRSEKDMMVRMSLQSAKELDEYNKQAQVGITSNTVKSVIHPVLIDHVIREGQRSIETLQRISDKK